MRVLVISAGLLMLAGCEKKTATEPSTASTLLPAQKFTEVQSGTGERRARADDLVTVRLSLGGSAPESLRFVVGRPGPDAAVNDLIRGMRVGEKRVTTIVPGLAGSALAPGSTVELELLDIESLIIRE